MPLKTPTQLQGVTDLTLIADIKPGLIEGIFDSRSYTWRLELVLALLDAARRATREADVQPSPFIDPVARLRDVHFFRFAVLRSSNQLLLNVTFDGGWEPYLRLIWGPLGTMLDLIFCHCNDYPLAATSSYEDYIRWVRRYEVPSQFFYADSGGTVADRAYLKRLELLQRDTGMSPAADLRAAQLALEALDAVSPPQASPSAVTAALRTLKGLFGLSPFFGLSQPRKEADDGSVLLRFGQDYLSDLRSWFAQGLFDPGQRFDTLRAPFDQEGRWLMQPRWKRPDKKDPSEKLNLALIQAGIVDSFSSSGGFVRGAMVLVRVKNPSRARTWLETSANATAGASSLINDGTASALKDKDVACTVAITYRGLQELGVRQDYLDAMPGEFTQGMERRAGILGDLRSNHPQQWKRPPAWPNAKSPAADLSLVHLVIQLRTSADTAGEDTFHMLSQLLEQWVNEKLVKDDLAASAIEVLGIEPTWSRPAEKKDPAPRNHFGYVDGISQPSLQSVPGLPAPPAADLWDDNVKTGEILLGWVNDRGDGPLKDPPQGDPAPPSWLDNGTFLVVRKILQHTERFDAIVDKAAQAVLAGEAKLTFDAAKELVRGKLMGRSSDGTPLAAPVGQGTNNFNFRLDTDGAKCPFASHVRRTNPRSALPGARPPRILRRGMSYGPPRSIDGGEHKERGVLFMAYNASIAEQFEVIQRWITGGNSSGVSSAQPDPFLGVPRAGEPTVFRFVHSDKVVRVDLGDQPVSKLEWGLYAFVPSMALLRSLNDHTSEPNKQKEKEAPPPPLTPEQWRQQVKAQFEDELRRSDSWKIVRSLGGVERIGATVMVGGLVHVKAILQDKGGNYSVSGYGDRMSATVGLSPFGQDDEGDNKGHELPFVAAVKNALANSVTEGAAYTTAYEVTTNRLKAVLGDSKSMGSLSASVDLIGLGSFLIAELCGKWFGVAYGPGPKDPTRGGIAAAATSVRCPGHFLTVARNVFSAYPNPVAEELAEAQGGPLREQVGAWVDAAARTPGNRPVLSEVLKAMKDAFVDEDTKKRVVANVMLGLPATMLGSWVKVLKAWADSRKLWELQHGLLVGKPNPGPGLVDPKKVLRDTLIKTMAEDPVADGIWRTVPEGKRGDVRMGTVQVNPGDKVWLGLGSALKEMSDDADLKKTEYVLFGGNMNGDRDWKTTHACPGREMAIGALCGGLAAVLEAGEWAATASPTTLSLKPFAAVMPEV